MPRRLAVSFKHASTRSQGGLTTHGGSLRRPSRQVVVSNHGYQSGHKLISQLLITVYNLSIEREPSGSGKRN